MRQYQEIPREKMELYVSFFQGLGYLPEGKQLSNSLQNCSLVFHALPIQGEFSDQVGNLALHSSTSLFQSLGGQSSSGQHYTFLVLWKSKTKQSNDMNNDKITNMISLQVYSCARSGTPCSSFSPLNCMIASSIISVRECIQKAWKNVRKKMKMVGKQRNKLKGNKENEEENITIEDERKKIFILINYEEKKPTQCIDTHASTFLFSLYSMYGLCSVIHIV